MKLPSLRKIWFINFTILLVILVISFFWFISFKNRTVQKFQQVIAAQNDNTIFYDIDNQPFHVLKGAEDRKYISLNHVSRNLQMSVVAIEDSRFFSHFGFDILRMGKAVLTVINPFSPVHGASTITQQLVKLTLLSPERTLKRKLTEIVMAVALETEYPKSKILEFYLNTVYLGHRNYGVENAALNYFHKSTSNLTLAESAFIAGLIKKPEGYSPFVNLKKARTRQVLVLKRMLALKWISGDQYKQAVTEHLLIRQNRKADVQKAPYFVNHILLKLKEKYGHKIVYGGGLRVYTTLDTQLQNALQLTFNKRLNAPRSFQEIAGVSIDPSTGFVKALIGGADFSRSQFNRVTQAKRQPGSSFKPILYAAALSRGIKPNDVFIDEPTQYPASSDSESEFYEPSNFSQNYSGPITMGYALQVSNNVVSVKLLNRIGIRSLAEVSQRFGITIPKEKGLCLALGCHETSLLEMTDAYSTFANNGYRNEPVFILKVTDNHGNILESYKKSTEHYVLSSGQAYQMNHMLQKVVNFGTGRNAKIERKSAGKTGTSDDFRDAWYIGYTPELVTGIWIGNDDNASMDRETGGKTPARLWKNYMTRIPEPKVQKFFPVHDEYEEYLLCNHSGKLSNSWCPTDSWYALLKGSAPTQYCDIHYEPELELRVCRTSGLLATEHCPISEIETRHYHKGEEPVDFCDIHTGESPLSPNQTSEQTEE